MHEYVLRVRRNGDEYTATVRELEVSNHPDVRAVIGPVSRGAGANPMAACVAAIAAHRKAPTDRPGRACSATRQQSEWAVPATPATLPRETTTTNNATAA